MELKLSEHFTYKKLILYVLPCVAMMILTSVYSIVDGFFVSNYAGKNAFAAVNLIMPVLMGVSSLGFMIGTGGSALVAFYLGLKNPKKANEVFSMLIELILLGTVSRVSSPLPGNKNSDFGSRSLQDSPMLYSTLHWSGS